jgi:hypothetical protein
MVPTKPTYDSAVDIGGRRVSTCHPGRVAGHARSVTRGRRPDAVYVPGHGAVVDTAFIRRQQGWPARISPL